MRTRSFELEIMDRAHPPADIARKFHRDLAVIHTLLGNWSAVIRTLRRGGLPRSVLDIGCGDGALLLLIRKRLGIQEVMGVDLKPPECAAPGIPIIAADAIHDALPRADAAVSVVTLHHFTDEQAVELIRNAGRSVKRFVCLDLVRHPLPLVLYTVFVCPLLSRVGAQDGRASIRRSFRPRELHALVTRALEGSGATFEHSVSPLYARQIIDIRWPDSQ